MADRPASIMMPRPGHRWTAEALLLITAMIWGFAFVAQRAGMSHAGPFAFNAIRFALGALILTPFVRKECTKRGATSVRGGALGILLTGIPLFLGASAQQAGLVHTTAGKAGFITGLYVVLVPLLALPMGHRPGRRMWYGATLAVAGLYLLSMQAGVKLASGDGLVLVGAFCWAAHVHAVGYFSPRLGPLRLAQAQFAVCAVLSVASAAVWESPNARLMGALVPLLYSGLLSVGVGYTLQVVAQERATPSAAAIILSLESVFAALGGWMMLGERLSGRQCAGCALMLAGTVWSQIPASYKRPDYSHAGDATARG